MKYRLERDSLGIVKVPAEAYFGSFTVRANENFQISGIEAPMTFRDSLATVKKAAAMTNSELGLLDKKHAAAIIKAAEEFQKGKFDDQFTLNVFQAGAGTPYNMNMNEIMANRANELLGSKKGAYSPLHPNNHVNMSQSTNDVIPTSIRLATLQILPHLLEELENLERTLHKKGREFLFILKVGRTHLQDAVPITLGQEFTSYAHALRKTREQIELAAEELTEIGIGGTALGTGINTHPEYAERMTKNLSKLTGIDLRLAKDLVETTNNMDVFASISGNLRRLATDLARIANDLKLLSMGPEAGIAEIILPDVEPGSSIMPGKINPSIPEAVEMVAYQVMGNDHTIALSAQRGQLELNVMTPIIMFNLLWSIELLTNTLHMFHKFCVEGIKANKERIKELFAHSRCVAAALNPYLGYQVTAEIVKEAQEKGLSIDAIIAKYKLIEPKYLQKIFTNATRPAIQDKKLQEKIKNSKTYKDFLKKLTP